jgi:hypothetical protein
MLSRNDKQEIDLSIVACGMRGCVIAPIAISISILMWAAFVDAFAAPPAPIGHRQPNASNVPASVLRAEPQRSADDIELDKRLNICPGC